MKKQLHFALFLLLPVLIPAQTFTESHELLCGDSVHINQLGYPTWNMPVIVTVPSHGTAVIAGEGSYSLIYESATDFQGLDTVVVECAHATQITCDTGIYVFHISCQTNTFNITSNATPVFIFPNPASEVVYIRGNLPGEILTITNAAGIVISRVEIPDTEDHILPVGLLSPGFYFISFQRGTERKTLPLAIIR